MTASTPASPSRNPKCDCLAAGYCRSAGADGDAGYSFMGMTILPGVTARVPNDAGWKSGKTAGHLSEALLMSGIYR
ncbi:hypothetical protein KCP70_00780 [Salmonella enterica subsp. enterica]|nr:hypothetical protein KCP70_00780 [Salmonella enterica subsp. enterica]